MLRNLILLFTFYSFSLSYSFTPVYVCACVGIGKEIFFQCCLINKEWSLKGENVTRIINKCLYARDLCIMALCVMKYACFSLSSRIKLNLFFFYRLLTALIVKL
jgi:hypothetical protein